MTTAWKLPPIVLDCRFRQTKIRKKYHWKTIFLIKFMFLWLKKFGHTHNDWFWMIIKRTQLLHGDLNHQDDSSRHESYSQFFFVLSVFSRFFTSSSRSTSTSGSVYQPTTKKSYVKREFNGFWTVWTVVIVILYQSSLVFYQIYNQVEWMFYAIWTNDVMLWVVGMVDHIEVSW